MADINITTEQEQIQLREIRRNSSNQIISYTLPDDSDKDYGYHKVPAITAKFYRAEYDRTIDQLSNELINPLPDVPLEIVSQNFIDESNIYRVSNSNQLVSIRQAVDIEAEDTFSGLYEMTSAGPWKRRQKTAAGNVHYFPIENQYTNGQRDYQDNAMGGRGFRPVPWDKASRGPQLESNGGYRITKELIESGRSLKLIASFGVANEKSDTHTFKFYFTRERINNDGRKTRSNQVHRPNQGTNIIVDNVVEFSVPSSDYPFLTFELDVENGPATMQEDDLWYVQAAASATNPIYWYGDKSYFEVIAFTADTPPIQLPNSTTGGASVTNGFIPNQQFNAVATGSATRDS